MRRLTILGIALGVMLSAPASAQQIVRPCVANSTVGGCAPVTATNPFPVTGSGSVAGSPNPLTTTETKVTIASTNVFQAALAASATRKGCTVQYLTGGGFFGYVFLGTSPADTTTSFELANGQTLNCNVGGLGVATDAVNVTGTTGDVFIVSSQ